MDGGRLVSTCIHDAGTPLGEAHPGDVKDTGEASQAIGGVSKHGRIVLRAEELYLSGTVR